MPPQTMRGGARRNMARNRLRRRLAQKQQDDVTHAESQS